MKTEKEDGLNELEWEDSLSAARGCLNGLIIGVVFWAIILGTVYLVRHI